MQRLCARILIAFCAVGLLTGFPGCVTKRLPKFEKPLKRSDVQKVRTTAYTHTQADHKKYGNRNALGTPLQYGEVTSAAADWSRWPAGTRFRVRATGREYIIDDYGWALSGTNTIDLYKPNKRGIREWGVRRVTIDIIEWGDVWESYRILKPRSRHAHVKRMVKQIEKRYRR